MADLGPVELVKHVVAFYRFVAIGDLEAFRADVFIQLKNLGVVGTLVIASEGVNATFVHQRRQVLKDTVAAIEARLGDVTLRTKYSTVRNDNEVFFRLKVKIRDEIIPFGKSLTAAAPVGTHVSATQWNVLLADPNVLVLDVRNHYEISAGAFEGAVLLGTNHFREFKERAQDLLNAIDNQTIAMYCTGGIRCEKASNFLKEQGCETVYQLDGGILGYLEDIKPNVSKWRGECFVFDQRVAVDAQLEQGHFDQCHACRRPLSEAEKRSPQYVKSVSCPFCYDETSSARKAQFAERAKQESLAIERGTRHVGLRQS